MRELLHVLLFACATSLAASASEASSHVVGKALPHVEVGEEGAVLSDWWVVGPWIVSAADEALTHDFLKEDDGADAVPDMPGDAWRVRHRRRTLHTGAWLGFAEALGISPALGVEAAVGYACCVLHAAEPREAWLLFGSDAQSAIWLNGVPIYRQETERTLRAYDDAVRLPLRRGDNVLLVKAVGRGRGWTFTARLEPTLDDAVNAVLGLNYKFFKQSLVAPGQALELYTRGIPEAASFEGQIARYDGTPVRAASIGPNRALSTEGLEEGLYRFVRSATSGPWASPVFYVGSYAGLYESMGRRVGALWVGLDDRTRINLHAYLRRLEVLRDAVQAALDKAGLREWRGESLLYESEHKAVYAASEVEESLAALARGEAPFRGLAGLHLRGFRSKMDGRVRYYRVFVPTRYRSEALGAGAPLFIIPPVTLGAERPFLESSLVANQREAEEWGRVAERLGVILLWSGYRESPSSRPLELAHFEEVLAAVRAEYRIDPRRVYLQGTCGAAVLSAAALRAHPKRYAALVLLNPVLYRAGENAKRGSPEAAANAEGAQAGHAMHGPREIEAIAAAAVTGETPVHILHDGADPGHGPLAHSVALVNALRAAGAPVVFERHQGFPPWAIRQQWVWAQLEWACGQSRAEAIN